MSLQTEMVGYVGITSKAIGSAVKLAEAIEDQAKVAVEKTPALVHLLKQAKLIEDHEVKEAENQLLDHGRSLDILHHVLNKTVTQARESKTAQAMNLGSGDPTERENVSGGEEYNKYANVTGHRYGADDPMPESDRKLFAALGVDLNR